MDEIINELIFEISETGQSKFCIAVSDYQSERTKSTHSILNKLESLGIKAKLIIIRRKELDLVNKLKDYIDNEKVEVFIIDGLDTLNSKSFDSTLANLNFKRDVIANLTVPIVLWVSTKLLRQLISRAPDFWSRRTSTYYFTHSSVQKLLSKIFGQERSRDYSYLPLDKISRTIKNVLSDESKLNGLVHFSEDISPLEIDKVVRKIKLGIDELIFECKRGNNIIVTLRLLNLTRIEYQFQRALFAKLKKARFPRSYVIYEVRDGIIGTVSKLIIDILINYKYNLISNIENGQVISLLGYFAQHTKYEKIGLDEKIESETEMIATNPSKLEKILSYAETVTIEETIRDQAVKNLEKWLETGFQLPAIFTPDEGKLLRFMYQKSRNASLIAKHFKISKTRAEERVSELQDKVHAFLGMI